MKEDGFKLPKLLKITLQGNVYEVSFPNVGQLIDIETKKMYYSKNMYAFLVSNSTIQVSLVLDFIDAISTFMVLIPDVKEKGEDLFGLNPIDSLELVTQYKQVFGPWFADWMKVLKETEEELTKKIEKGNG